jgi:dTDP-4-dehydrorhamnose reductase
MPQTSKADKPTLLILGARGFLGSVVSTLAFRTHHVLRADRTNAQSETDLVVDIANPIQVVTTIREIRPDQVILLAAISDIDQCERDPNQAIAVNLRGAEHVANACAQTGARLLFTSSGAVFDGKKIGYYESDSVSPLSIYAQTKADAEQSVLALLPHAIVVRVSLVLGRATRPGTNSLVDSLMRRWSVGETIRAATHEWRNPIDVLTLSTWFLELLANPNAAGILHTGASEAASRFEIASALANQLGIAPELVTPEDQPTPGRAPRGAHQHLLSTRLPQLCTTPIPDFQSVIKRSLHEVAYS